MSDPSRSSSLRNWLFRLSLALPTVLFLLVLEVAARVHAWHSDSILQEGLATVGAGPESDDLSLQHIIRWHRNPKIIYDLIPNLSGEFRDHWMTVNADGFRSATVPVSPEQPTFRLVGIGDSVMFGWGVGDGEDYLSLTGRKLSELAKGQAVDWINSAVPGYNTVNEVETLKEKLLRFKPDVVVVGYVNNDLFVPGFIRKPRPYLSLKHSFLAQWVRNTIDGLHVPDNELRRPPDDFRHRTFVGEEQLIPEAYREVIGISAFRQALVELDELARAHRFAYVVFAHYGFSPEVVPILEELGTPVLDAYPVLTRWLRDHGIDTYRGSPLTVSEQDSHPSALFHEILAAHLASWIVQQMALCRNGHSSNCARDPAVFDSTQHPALLSTRHRDHIP